MGTSKAYSASIKNQPQWGELSSIVTTSCGAILASNDNLNKILSRYVNVIGGAAVAGRGGSKVAGRSSSKTARKLGGFLGNFVNSGGDLLSTLDTLGLKGLEGKSLREVLNHLIEYLTGPAIFIDDVAAKAAANKLIEEFATNANSIDEFQINLLETLNSTTIEDLLIKYFGYYIFEHLSIMFYEKLVVEKGKSECNSLFSQVKDFISEKLANMNRKNPLANMNWKGSKVEEIVFNIQQDVLTVFENYEG